MTEAPPIRTWLTDMDGVLVHEESPIPGATDFVDALKASGNPLLVLTNNSIYTARDLRARLLASGIDVPEESIWTSAMATAQFLAHQRPGAAAARTSSQNCFRKASRGNVSRMRLGCNAMTCWACSQLSVGTSRVRSRSGMRRTQVSRERPRSNC